MKLLEKIGLIPAVDRIDNRADSTRRVFMLKRFFYLTTPIYLAFIFLQQSHTLKNSLAEFKNFLGGDPLAKTMVFFFLGGLLAFILSWRKWAKRPTENSTPIYYAADLPARKKSLNATIYGQKRRLKMESALSREMKTHTSEKSTPVLQDF